MKKLIIIFLIFLTSLQAQAFEDFILSADSKISNIKIEDTSIININPLATILNEKNVLFITPQKIGKTSFSLQKNDKTYKFDVVIKENETIISKNNEFEIISLDTLPQIFDYQIDVPPIFKKKETINIDGAIIEIDTTGKEVENG